MNNQEIKEKIMQAIANAKSKGYTLVSGHWGDQEMKCSCPLGCVNLEAGGSPEDTRYSRVQSVLDINGDWIQSFIDGFDDNGTRDGAVVLDAWSLGEEIRLETDPMSYEEFIDSMDEP